MANQEKQQEDQTSSQEELFFLEERQLEGVTGGGFLKWITKPFVSKKPFHDDYAEMHYSNMENNQALRK